MDLVVTEVREHSVICGVWEFDKVTGLEIDEELGWDGKTKSGSFIQL